MFSRFSHTTVAAGHRRDSRQLLPADVVRGHGGPRVRGHVEPLVLAAHRPLLLALGGDRPPRKASQATLFHLLLFRNGKFYIWISRSPHLFFSSILGGILLVGGLYCVLWGKTKEEETRVAMASGYLEQGREQGDADGASCTSTPVILKNLDEDKEAGGRKHKNDQQV